MNDLRAVIDCPADRWRICPFCGTTYLFMGIKSARNSLRDPMLCRPDVRVVYDEHLVAIGKLETMANAKKFIGIVWGHLDFEELTFTLFAANGEKNCGACVQLWFKMASVARMLRLILILLARLAYLKFALSGKKRKWQIEAAKFFTLLLFSYLHINKWNIL